MKITVFFCILASFVMNAAAQEKFQTQYAVGVNIMPSWNISLRTGSGSSDYLTQFGVSFEARFTNHSGIESGLSSWRIFPHVIGGKIPKEWYLSVPVLYKFYSPIVNVAAGITNDFSVSSHSENDYQFGLMLKVTKDIRIYKGLIFEPGVYFNPYLGSEEKKMDNAFWGFSARLKYRF